MYPVIKIMHSYWAYLVLILLIIACVNAISGLIRGKRFGVKDFRLSLFTLIVTHIQLLIGLIMYFLSPYFANLRTSGFGSVMKNEIARLYTVEHPFMLILTVVFVTIGFSKHKKKNTDRRKFKSIAIYYSIALFCALLMIPWKSWLGI